MRVVSLLPSATELCYALGVEPVGVSHECDHPPQAREQPTVVHSRVDASASSQEVNHPALKGRGFPFRRRDLQTLAGNQRCP